jgi:hypothetical protein
MEASGVKDARKHFWLVDSKGKINEIKQTNMNE